MMGESKNLYFTFLVRPYVMSVRYILWLAMLNLMHLEAIIFFF